jgi:hypothetical protein
MRLTLGVDDDHLMSASRESERSHSRVVSDDEDPDGTDGRVSGGVTE